MTATDLTVQEVNEDVLNITTSLENADNVNGNAALNPDGDLMIYAENPGASSATMTITAQSTSKENSSYGKLTKGNLAVVIPAGEARMVGPLPKGAYNDSAGKVQIAFSDTGAPDVDLVAIRLKKY